MIIDEWKAFIIIFCYRKIVSSKKHIDKYIYCDATLDREAFFRNVRPVPPLPSWPETGFLPSSRVTLLSRASGEG